MPNRKVSDSDTHIICRCCKENLERDKFAAYKIKNCDYICRSCLNNLANETRKRGAKYIENYKKSRYCEICGETDYRVLQFDHIDPESKEGNVSDLAKYAISKIEKEIEKCRLVCAHCHTRKNWNLRKLGIDSYA